MSPSASTPEGRKAADEKAPSVRFPTETEIYLLPDGTVVIADLPAELAPLAAALGTVEPCHVEPTTTRTAREHT